jgi:hypothetical protein
MLVDLQAQFTNRIPGAADMDAVRIAASNLMNAAAESDSDDIAEAIASVLEASTDSHSPELLTVVLSSSSSWSSVKGIDAVVEDESLVISGTIERDCNGGCAVELDFSTSIPLGSANLKIREIN